jgi:hypothetical protein
MGTEMMTANVARVVLNYLNSFTMFVGYCDMSMQRQYGELSDEHNRFKTVVNEEYDTVFAYRFLYKFRNFAQHLGSQIDSVSPSETASVDSALQIVVKRDRLLRGGVKVWKRVVWAELHQLPERVVLSDYLHELHPCIDKIRRAFYREQAATLREAATRIRALLEEIAAAAQPPYFPVFAQISTNSGEPHGAIQNVSVKFIPQHAVDAALLL